MEMKMLLILMFVITLVENEPISNICNRTTNCAETLGCAFVKGMCEIFAGCELYEQQWKYKSGYNCEEISKYCIWDGKSEFCQDKKYCKDMNFEECGNINQLNGDKYSCQWDEEENKCQQKECSTYSQSDCELHRKDCYLGSQFGECLGDGLQCEKYRSTKCLSIKPPIGECSYSLNDDYHQIYCYTKECDEYYGKSITDCEQYKNKENHRCTYIYDMSSKCSTPCITGYEDTCIQETSENYCNKLPLLCYRYSGCVDIECFEIKNSNECAQKQNCQYDQSLCRNKYNTCINYMEQLKCTNQCKWSNEIVRVKQYCSDITNEYLCTINQQQSGIPCIWNQQKECIENTETKQCNVYMEYREECMQSQICFYTGKQCLHNSEKYCDNFVNQNYCNSDYMGYPCIWNDDFPENKKCQRFAKCSDITDTTANCSLYSSNCVSSFDQKCVPKTRCNNSEYRYKGSSYKECQAYSPNCASDGIHCIQIADCEYYNEIVCQDSKDSNGNFCFWNSNKCQKRLTYCQGYNSSLCESNVQQTTLEGILCFFDQKNKICRPKQCSDLNEKECDSLKLCIEVNSKTVCEENRCQIPQQGEQKKCQLITSQCIQQKDQFLCQVLGAQEGKCKWENKCLLLERNTTYYNPKDKYRVNPMKDYQSILIFIAVQFIMQF